MQVSHINTSEINSAILLFNMKRLTFRHEINLMCVTLANIIDYALHYINQEVVAQLAKKITFINCIDTTVIATIVLPISLKIQQAKLTS